MLAWMTSLGAWNWFIAAAVLFAVELFAPGAFMLWLGLAAIVVGAVSLAIAWSWQAQVIAFAILSLASIPAWRHFARRIETPSDQPHLNRRSDGYVGRVFALQAPIAEGFGAVRIDDTVWRVAGPELAAGRRVRVVRADGALLHVVSEADAPAP